jgi:E3 ubiquitin-protein ligase HUWE1
MMFDQFPSLSSLFPSSPANVTPVDGPGAVSFGGGWQDDVEPPVIVHRRPRGGFSPFPLFPGGPRDPLGGTFPFSQNLL